MTQNIKFDLSNVANNDANYVSYNCPVYCRWYGMIHRCYANPPTGRVSYKDKFVTAEWLTFSNFKTWMDQQDWKGKQLDKDLLVPGNKIYSPQTCIFIDARVNSFITERGITRGEYPIGVYLQSNSPKFKAMCRSVVDGKNKHLGYHNTPEEAHDAWLAFKLEQAYILAAVQSDERVAKALIYRYENYKNLFDYA